MRCWIKKIIILKKKRLHACIDTIFPSSFCYRATHLEVYLKHFSNTLYIRSQVTLSVARKAIRVLRDIPRSLSLVIQLSRMDATSVWRSSGVSSVVPRARQRI